MKKKIHPKIFKIKISKIWISSDLKWSKLHWECNQIPFEKKNQLKKKQKKKQRNPKKKNIFFLRDFTIHKKLKH